MTRRTDGTTGDMTSLASTQAAALASLHQIIRACTPAEDVPAIAGALAATVTAGIPAKHLLTLTRAWQRGDEALTQLLNERNR